MFSKTLQHASSRSKVLLNQKGILLQKLILKPFGSMSITEVQNPQISQQNYQQQTLGDVQYDQQLEEHHEQDKQDMQKNKNKSHLFQYYYEINVIEKKIQEIISSDTKYQITSLRDLFLKTHSSQKSQLIKLAQTKYGQQLALIFQKQGRYYMSKNNTKQFLLVLRLMGMYGTYFFQQSSKFCEQVDEYVISQMLENDNILQYISLIRIYCNQLLKIDKVKYMKTTQKLHQLILMNQKHLPDDAIIAYYCTVKNILDVKQEDIKLNFNEEASNVAKIILQLRQQQATILVNQLIDYLSSKEIDIQTLYMFIRYDLNLDRIDLLKCLQNIKDKQLIKYSNKSEQVYTLVSITNLFKHLIHYFQKDEKVQQVKNIGSQSTTRKQIPFTSNCTEIQPIFLHMGYSTQQEECIKVLLDITKLTLRKFKEIESENLTSFRINLYYQISKLQIEIEPEVIEEIFQTIQNQYIKGNDLINTFCILCNFYQYKQYRDKIHQLIDSIEPWVLKQLKEDREVNELFTLTYVAYLCNTKLDRNQLSNKILQIMEKSLDQNKFSCYQALLTVNFLENLSQKDKQSQVVLQKLIPKINVDKFDYLNISQGLIHSKSSNTQTLSLILDYFERNQDKLELKNLTLCLHLMKKKGISHLIQQNSKLVSRLKQRFLDSEHKDNYLLVEYRRNNLMDEKLLQSVEQYALDLKAKNNLTFPQMIDYFYNITRLRFASQQFIQNVEEYIPKCYNQLSFADFIKLINSLMASQINAQILQNVINELIDRIHKNKFILENESFQQRKLFYIYLLQIQTAYPNIKVNSQIIDDFSLKMKSLLEVDNSEQELSESDEENQDAIRVDDSPYEKYIQQALQELNVQYIREYRISFIKIDFFLPQLNACIEFNGDLHYFQDKLTPPTLHKINYLESLNYKVFTIKGSEWRSQHLQGFKYETVLQWIKQLIQESK